MNLLLIRHADAVSLGESGVQEDEERPLSDKGVAQCRPLARALHRLGVQLGTVVSSPLLRARQTAEGLLQHWEGDDAGVANRRSAGAGGEAPEASETAVAAGDADGDALVGHMPDLATARRLADGRQEGAAAIAKAGAAYLVGEPAPPRAARC